MGNRTYNGRNVAVSAWNAAERTIHARRRHSDFWKAHSKTLCISMNLSLPISEALKKKKPEKKHTPKLFTETSSTPLDSFFGEVLKFYLCLVKKGTVLEFCSILVSMFFRIYD